MPQPFVYLASRSPRRRELLQQVGVQFELVDIEVDETPVADECDLDYVERLAQTKAAAGLKRLEGSSLRGPVLGADTTIGMDHHILGKPRDERDAVDILAALSGRSHQVITAVALATPGRTEVVTSTSQVWFRETTVKERTSYVASGEPMDKAGAYAIQGKAAGFIERIEGSYSGVMGLPLFETTRLLSAFGLPIL